MATLTPQLQNTQGATTVAAETLDLSNDFVFKKYARQLILLENNTGGVVNVNFLGDSASSSINIPGSAIAVDASAGYDVSIANGETAAICLDTIYLYLIDANNTPSLTCDVAGLEATLVEFTA